MPFDPSTAEPVTAVVEPSQFDPATAEPVVETSFEAESAKPVGKNEKYRNEFTIPEEQFRAATPLGRLKLLISHPWDKYVASVDEGFKGGVEIPRVEAGEGDSVAARAKQAGAATVNTVSGVAGGALSAGGLGTIIHPEAAAYVAPRFIVGGAKDLVGDAKENRSDFDALVKAKEQSFGHGQIAPQEKQGGSLQSTMERMLGGVLQLAGGLGGAKAGIEKTRAGLTKESAPKTPDQAIDLIKEEASKTEDPVVRDALAEAAAKISDSAKKGVAFDPATAQPVVGPESTKLSATPEGAKKLAEIEEALKSPDTVIQYSVWDKEMILPGADRTAQVDLINPKSAESERGGIASTNRALLQELGIEAPAAPDSLPPGRYTLDEIKAAIAKETPPVSTSEVGLGAASPAEFRPVEEFTTSIKNAVVDQEMQARGETPLMSEAAKDFGSTWNDAMKRIEENQNVADELLAELKTKIRPIESVENAILLHRKIDLENAFNKASRNIRENIGTPDSLAADRIAKQRALDDLLELNKISRATGTEQSSALNTRKLMAAQDFSLSSMIEKVSAAKGDIKLTPDEVLATEAAHQKIADAQRALDESAPDQININQAKLDQAKTAFDETLGRFRYEQLSTTRKFLSNAADTWDLIRNIYSSGEFSVVLRQGLLPLASRPITTAKAIPKSVKAFLSDEVMARKIDLDTLNSPEAAIARKAGVQLDEPGQKLGQREESIASEWAKKIPGLRNFNQFSRVFLNKVRVDNFNAMKNIRPDLKPEELKLIAKYVNQATGRGSLGKFGEKNAAELNRVLFSARFQASRLQYLTGNSMWGGNGRTRSIIGREYARTLLGLTAMYGLYQLGFSDEEGYKPVSFEPRGTDFGKLHFGKATVDPLAGLSQWIVFGARTGLTLADSLPGIETGGQSINSKGELVSLRNPKFGQDNLGDVAARFGRSKLHPLVGATWSATTGRDIINQPTSWLQEAEKFEMPMTYEDILNAFKTMDVDQATAVSALAMLGMGLNVQQDKAKKQMGVARPETDAKKQLTLPSGKKVNVRPAK